jgi:transcriptional regulator with XRE-family HTH domain
MVGQRIATLRREHGWSQEQLAAMVPMQRSNLSRIETGETTQPTIFVLVRLARALGVTVDSLLAEPEPVEAA